MDCSRCGDRVAYDRLTVDRTTGVVEGSLCVDCEDALLNGHADSEEILLTDCVGCDDDPELLFPRWDSIVEHDVNDVDTEYHIDLQTPGSCRECFEDRA